MKLISIPPQGIFMVNSYIIISENGDAVLIDAPCGADRILNIASQNNAVIKKILITHGHCDHIESLNEIAEATGAVVYIHKNDVSKLTDSYSNLSDNFKPYLRNRNISLYDKAIPVSDNDVITLDELNFKVMHTPGHTSGCVCYIIDNIIFSGDTLFNMSIGRTDMYDGNSKTLLQSLKKLSEFSGNFDDYTIFAGHGETTTLSEEQMNNPYLQ